MISVITCSRPQNVLYVDDLLKVLREYQIIPTVFKDTQLKTPPDNKYIAWYVFRQAAKTSNDLLFLEDDVLPMSETALQTAINYVVPDNCAWSSLCLSTIHASGRHPAAQFAMSQALKIPNKTLQALVNFATTHQDDWLAVRGVDTAMAVVGKYSKWQFEQSSLACFEHVGKISVAHSG